MKSFRTFAIVVTFAWLSCTFGAAWFSGRVNAWCNSHHYHSEASFYSAVFSVIIAPVALMYHTARWVEIRSAGRCY